MLHECTSTDTQMIKSPLDQQQFGAEGKSQQCSGS